MGDESVIDHLLKHQVTASHGTLGVTDEIVTGGCVDHTGHQGAFLQVHVLGVLVQKSVGGRTDAESVMSESHVVEIHGNDFFLRIIMFQLGCCTPFLQFAQDEFGRAYYIKLYFKLSIFCY